MCAAPVDAEETYASHVENNGHAMAAYMMAVGLWVACLAYCILFNPYESPLKGKNALRAGGRNLPVLLLVSWAQAIGMVFFLHLFNDLRISFHVLSCDKKGTFYISFF